MGVATFILDSFTGRGITNTSTNQVQLKRFQRLHGPRDMEFAAYQPFYALCHTTYIDDDEVSDKPIRLFHGVADDWVLVAPWARRTQRLALGGAPEATQVADRFHLLQNLAEAPEQVFHTHRTALEAVNDAR